MRLHKYIYTISILFFTLWGANGCGAPATEADTALQAREETHEETLSQKQIPTDGVAYLNILRQKVSLAPLIRQDALEQSAYAHAAYLLANDLYTHSEERRFTGFSGVTPMQRAIRSGYQSGSVLENIYAGDVDATDSIDILFSDIYHRFAFLHFAIRDIGVADLSDPGYRYRRVHTYEMGIPANPAAAQRSASPEIVVWPYENAEDILPVFYEEEPDPLPECSVSGYPISVQFAPDTREGVMLQSLKLYDAEGKEVEDTVILDAQSDPNRLFQTGTYALMPMKRLEWGSRYRVEMRYTDAENLSHRKSWFFSTRQLPGKVIRIEPGRTDIKIRHGQTHYLYLVPAACNDKFNTYSYRYTPTLQIEEKMIDNNTVMLKADGRGEIEIRFDNGRAITVKVI